MSEIEDFKEELKRAEGLEETLKLLVNSVKDLEEKKLQSINDALGYLQGEKARTEELIDLLNALRTDAVLVKLEKMKTEGKLNFGRERRAKWKSMKWRN